MMTTVKMRFRKAKPGADETGFSFLEIMIALVILALVLAAVGGLRNRDIQQHALARDLTTGTLLAQLRMSQMEMAEFPALGETTGRFEPPYDGFEWVQNISVTPFEFAREIHVQVKWKTFSATESLELVSYAVKSE